MQDLDLWPTNIGMEIDNTPVEIMREQAELLGEKTKNLVKADVTIGSTYHGDKFAYYFYIVAPTLNNYHFLLFTVEHGVEMYPLTIYVDETLGKELDAESRMFETVAMYQIIRSIMDTNGNEKEPVRHFLVLSSEDEFTSSLRRIFSSQRTQQIIGSLLSQVNANYEQPLS